MRPTLTAAASGIGQHPVARDEDHLLSYRRETVLEEKTDRLRIRFRLMIREEHDVLARAELPIHLGQMLGTEHGRLRLVHERAQEVEAERVVVEGGRDLLVVRLERVWLGKLRLDQIQIGLEEGSCASGDCPLARSASR